MKSETAFNRVTGEQVRAVEKLGCRGCVYGSGILCGKGQNTGLRCSEALSESGESLIFIPINYLIPLDIYETNPG